MEADMLKRPRVAAPLRRAVILSGLLLALVVSITSAQAPDSFRFAILGDRTGDPQPGVYEQVWKEVAAEHPAFAVSVGDTIEGMNDASAVAEWQQIDHLLAPFRRIPLYLTPGNHDIWSPASEEMFKRYAKHAAHYSFDYGPAHFTILDNSRSEELAAEELAFLESDLKAHARQPLKFVISHRPSWLVNAALGNADFPLHQLARRYGVRYVIAGHVHQILHIELQGVAYVSMPSSGGHLRLSRAYQDGWFFGYSWIEVTGGRTNFQIKELKAPRGQGRISKVTDWGLAGLLKQEQREPVPAQ
jgi:3',5'-cyclic AMP phosphodiesterase CpdA